MKLLFVILAGVGAFALLGCNNSVQQSSRNSVQQSSRTEPTQDQIIANRIIPERSNEYREMESNANKMSEECNRQGLQAIRRLNNRGYIDVSCISSDVLSNQTNSRFMSGGRENLSAFDRQNNPVPSHGVSLSDMVEAQCKARGWSAATASWNRCIQDVRVSIAASGPLSNQNNRLQVFQQAAHRCESAGLRRGTNDFAACSIQAQANIEIEIRNQQAMQDAERQRAQQQAEQQAAQQQANEALREAIERARRDAENERRRQIGMQQLQLGLGLMAGGGRVQSSTFSMPPRVYNINGRTFTCNTVGTFTNCN